MLEIQILKSFQVKRVVIHGDSELVIKQMQGEYHEIHPRMRIYRNVSLDLIEYFEPCDFSLIPILQNGVIDSLATFVALFKIPIYPNRRYEIEVKHRPFVPDNVKNWQVFEDDKQIQNFLHLTGEFEGLTIDEDNLPPNGASHFEKVLQNQTDFSEEVIQDEPVVPAEVVVGNESEKVGGPELEEPDGKQEYLNSICGKEILQLKGNSIPGGLVPLENM